MKTDICGVNRKSAAYYFLRLREIIAFELERAEQEVFADEIEVYQRPISGYFWRNAQEAGFALSGDLTTVTHWHKKDC